MTRLDSQSRFRGGFLRSARFRRSALLFAVVSMAIAAGCARCGGPGSVGSERFVSASSPGLVFVPSGGALADKAQALLSTARGGPGGERLVKLSADIARQLGFDPLTRAGLEAAGIDPSRSWAAALGTGEADGAAGATGSEAESAAEGSGVYLVLPFKDRAKLEETLTRLAEARLGALTRGSTEVRGVKLVTLSPESAVGPAFSYAAEAKHIVLASGEDAPQLVASAVLRARGDGAASLASGDTLSTLKKRLGAREVYVHLRRGVDAKGLWSALAPEAISAGVGVDAKELSLRLFVGVEAERLDTLRSVVVGGGSDLLPLIPGGSPLVVRGGVDLAALAKALDSSAPGKSALAEVRALAAAAEVDLEKDLLENLEPGFALSIGLAAEANLSRAFDLDPRRNNPFGSYALRGIGRVKDPERAKAALEKIVALGSRFGADIGAQDVDGVRVYTARYRLGEGLSWALSGNALLVTGGLPNTLVPWAKQLAAKPSAVEGGVKSAEYAVRAREVLFGDPGVAVSLDVARLRDRIEELPLSAFGYGPGALMARSVTNNVIQPLARLKGVAALAPVEEGFTLDLSVGVQ